PYLAGGRARRRQTKTGSERVLRRPAREPIADGKALRAARINLKVKPDASGVRDLISLPAWSDLGDADRRQSLAGHEWLPRYSAPFGGQRLSLSGRHPPRPTVPSPVAGTPRET